MYVRPRLVLVTHRVIKSDGQGRVNYEVARAAIADGYEVHVIAAEVSPELLRLPHFTWKRVSHGPFPTALLKDAWFAVGSAYALRSARKATTTVMVNGAVTIGRSDINVVHMVHGAWIRSPNFRPGDRLMGAYRRLYAWLNAGFERSALKNAARVVSVSGKVARELSALKVPPAKLRVIPNGVNANEFAPGPVERVCLGLPAEGTLALFVGDIASSIKNLETVLHALQQVPDVTLIVVGDVRNSPFPLLTQSLGLNDRVLFVGFRLDVPQIMKACDIFVFPSRYESCGLVILEAMASGLPVITAKTAGAVELIDEGAAITIDNPNDVELIRFHLQELVEDPDKRGEIGNAARRCALKLTWENTSNAYLELFEEIAREKDGVASAVASA